MKNILSVDDSASIRQMVKLTLSGAGYNVLEAADGAQGLAKARRKAVDVVVTDLNMPVMDGLTLIREVRKLPAYARRAHHHADHRKRRREEGASQGGRRHRLDHQAVPA